MGQGWQGARGLAMFARLTRENHRSAFEIWADFAYVQKAGLAPDRLRGVLEAMRLRTTGITPPTRSRLPMRGPSRSRASIPRASMTPHCFPFGRPVRPRTGLSEWVVHGTSNPAPMASVHLQISLRASIMRPAAVASPARGTPRLRTVMSPRLPEWTALRWPGPIESKLCGQLQSGA